MKRVLQYQGVSLSLQYVNLERAPSQRHQRLGLETFAQQSTVAWECSCHHGRTTTLFSCRDKLLMFVLV